MHEEYTMCSSDSYGLIAEKPNQINIAISTPLIVLKQVHKIKKNSYNVKNFLHGITTNTPKTHANTNPHDIPIWDCMLNGQTLSIEVTGPYKNIIYFRPLTLTAYGMRQMGCDKG